MTEIESTDTAREDEAPKSSRRTLFKVAGVGLAGVAGAALLESPAAAATDLTLGTSNTATATTSLENTSADGYALQLNSTDAFTALYVQGGLTGGAGIDTNGGGGGLGLLARGGDSNATLGAAAAVSGAGGTGFGVHGGAGAELSGGESSVVGGIGVDVSGGDGETGGGVGVNAVGGRQNGGTGPGGTALVAVGGPGHGGGQSGVAITATGGNGVTTGLAGVGLIAAGGSDTAIGGIGIQASGGSASASPLQLVPSTITGAPTTGAHSLGEIFVDKVGSMWICAVAGTPGIWVRVVTALAGATTPGTHLLAHPIRMFSKKIATKHSAAVQVTGRTVSGLQVPAGAVGVIGTLSVSGTGTHGHLSTYATAPHASTPLTTSLSWKGKDQMTSAQVTIALASTGKCVIANGFKASSTAAHVTFDVVGYLT
jgi:hypothetical protein